MKIDNDLRRKLIALTGCAGHRQNPRPVLSTIGFRKDSAVATDSYVLGYVPLSDGPKRPRVVPAHELAAALRRVSKSDECEIAWGTTEATLTVQTASLFGASTRTQTLPYLPAEMEYPEVDKLIPKARGTKREAPHFASFRLQQVADLGDEDMPIRLHWTDPHKPIVVTVRDAFIGLVMPVRTGDEPVSAR